METQRRPKALAQGGTTHQGYTSQGTTQGLHCRRGERSTRRPREGRLVSEIPFKARAEAVSGMRRYRRGSKSCMLCCCGAYISSPNAWRYANK